MEGEGRRWVWRGSGHVDGGDMLMATWEMGVVTFPSPCRLSIAISFVPRESGREGGRVGGRVEGMEARRVTPVVSHQAGALWEFV